MSEKNTFTQRYTISHVLGEGGFGKVYAGTRNQDSLPVAIKVIGNFRMNPALKRPPLEVRLLHKLSHIKGVIRLIDACYSGGSLIIVMERVENAMDLLAFAEKHTLTPELTRSLFRQLVETVIECHSAGVVHRDIKPENILIDVRTNTIKLIDFGCACYFKEFQSNLKGTPEYQPPELFRDGRCRNVSSTIWSLGVTLYVLCADRFPYDDIWELEKLDAEDITFPEGVPMQCQDLIRSILKFDPNERPSLEEVLLHPYLRTQSSVSTGCSSPVTQQHDSYIPAAWNSSLDVEQTMLSLEDIVQRYDLSDSWSYAACTPCA